MGEAKYIEGDVTGNTKADLEAVVEEAKDQEFIQKLAKEDQATAKLFLRILEAITELKQSPDFLGFGLVEYRSTQTNEITSMHLIVHDQLGDVITPREV